MAKQYSIAITNGTGTEEILKDTYSVSALVNGYDNATIEPDSMIVADGTTTQAFTIAADGTLTLHVTEDGTAEGTPIVGATFIRLDSAGNEYGEEITSDANGDAVFENVPYSATETINIYYKQTASDGEHDFDDTQQTTSLTAQTGTEEIENPGPQTVTITLTDANYENLPIEEGTINLS